ncbi:MAG: ABC transporter permease [Pseudomonadota bacterium]
MDPLRTWAIFRKELIQIRRDPSSLVQIVLLPVVLLLLYGYALTFDINHVPIAVFNREGSPAAEEFINRFAGSPYFEILRRVGSYGEISTLIDDGRIRAAIVLPDDFSRRLRSDRTATVQAIVDGTDANTANIVIGYIQAVSADYNQRVMVRRLNAKGLTGMAIPVRAEPRVWFNEDLESRNFIVPGLIVVIMTLVGALLTALSVVREVERGSMEGLMATPLKRTELIIGKLGPYFMIGMLDLALAMAMGQFLFHVPLRGSPVLQIGLSALFLLVMLGQGLLISVSASSQLEANQLAMLTTFLPAFLLSGFVFAIRQMPWWLRAASHIVPAKYFVTISKGIYLKGIGLEILWPEALVLAGSAAFFLVAATRRFKKKMT